MRCITIAFIEKLYYFFYIYILLTVHLDISSGRWRTWRTILLYNAFISVPEINVLYKRIVRQVGHLPESVLYLSAYKPSNIKFNFLP